MVHTHARSVGVPAHCFEFREWSRAGGHRDEDFVRGGGVYLAFQKERADGGVHKLRRVAAQTRHVRECALTLALTRRRGESVQDPDAVHTGEGGAGVA